MDYKEKKLLREKIRNYEESEDQSIFQNHDDFENAKAALTFQEKIDAEEKKYRGKNIVADYYQLARLNGKTFSLETKKLIRPNVTIEMSHYFQTNDQWNNSGKMYLLKEDETETFIKQLDAHKANLAKKKKIAETGAAQLTAAIVGITEKAEKNAAVEIEEEEAEGHKTRKGRPKQTFGVDLELKMSEALTPEQIKDAAANYIFTGTKVECETFIKKG